MFLCPLAFRFDKWWGLTWTKISPGLEDVINVSGTRESTHPIQRILGACHQHYSSVHLSLVSLLWTCSLRSITSEKHSLRKRVRRRRHTCPVANFGNKSGISSLHPFAQILFPSINPFNSGNWAQIGERLEEDAVAFSGCRCLSTSDIGVAVKIFLLVLDCLNVGDLTDLSVDVDLKPEGLISLVKDWMMVVLVVMTSYWNLILCDLWVKITNLNWRIPANYLRILLFGDLGGTLNTSD